jgi:hypothetical protein
MLLQIFIYILRENFLPVRDLKKPRVKSSLKSAQLEHFLFFFFMQVKILSLVVHFGFLNLVLDVRIPDADPGLS